MAPLVSGMKVQLLQYGRKHALQQVRASSKNSVVSSIPQEQLRYGLSHSDAREVFPDGTSRRPHWTRGETRASTTTSNTITARVKVPIVVVRKTAGECVCAGCEKM
eukprot:RCo006173